MSAITAKKRLPRETWYADGLAFECQNCGACCAEAPGYVWVEDNDLKRMAAKLGISQEEFERRYTRIHKGRTCLRERADYDCVMLHREDRTCLVYEERPVQCRTWPWWKENLQDRDSWEACKSSCPGIGKGRIHSAKYIYQRMTEDWDINGNEERGG